MRGSTVMTLCLGLSACAVDNPGFAPASNSSPGSGTTTDGPVTTSVTATSDASGTSSGASGDADTNPSEPVTSSSEPGTSTSGTSSGGDSSTGPLLCQVPPVNDAFEPLVFKGGAQFVGCGPSLTLKGHVVVSTEIEFYNDPNCGDLNPPTTYLLGTGYPPFVGQAPLGCSQATVSFKPDPACEIAQIWIAPLDDINTPLVFGAFTAPALMPFPIKPTAIQESYCGCPEGGDDPNICCDELQPGRLSLIPTDGGPVAQSNHEPVEVAGHTYEFYNLESWMGPECTDAPGAGRHIDWIAVAAP